ncbi:MAG TPA: caspase family protein [Flavobacteriales bacterium]|nr:caspase family protein [Flavobacteriales bacterium]
MTFRTLHLVLLTFLLAGQLCKAQGGKSFLKEGDAFRKENELEKALEKYGLAIAVDPKLIKAYQSRAEVNVLMGRPLEVARDLKHIAALEPADAALGAAAARAYLDIDSATIARDLCNTALKVDRKNMEALQFKTRACLKLGDLDCATEASDAALALKATTDTYFLHGLARAAVRDYKTAETDFDRVLEWNHLYEAAYVELANVQLELYEVFTGTTMQMRTLDKAVEKCTVALDLNPQSTDALFTRSRAYAAQKEYAKAIEDISRCIALGRTDQTVYHQRALYYSGLGQHQNAVNDLNKILLDNPDDVDELVLRATSKEANLDMEGALKDLELAQRSLKANPGSGHVNDQQLEESRVRIAKQVFEMNRESDPPRLTILEPYSKDSVAQVSMSLRHLKVSGHVLDKSKLKSITVNGGPAQFDHDEKDPQFFTSIPWVATDKEIIVQVTDIYDNFTSQVLKVERTEGTPPSVIVTTPAATQDRVVTIMEDKESIFLEGRVNDESLIRLVAVDGVNASYAPDQLNPEFSIKLDVKDKSGFSVHTEDQFGNATDVAYTLVRKAAPVVVASKPVPSTSAKEPTPASTAPAATRSGATWVIHIENTNYRNFPAVQSGGDAAKIQKAFGNYTIARTLNKKNLSKEQLDRFFNIELRDLVRTNKIGTILVWYSGHGRTVGGKAYWVPVDARKDDIYSYFNYGSLKAQMQNYSESVDNTVVVSDATGSESSFYELTR